MSTEICWIRQEAQQAISNIRASVKAVDELSPAPDTLKDNVAAREKRSTSLCPLRDLQSAMMCPWYYR